MELKNCQKDDQWVLKNRQKIKEVSEEESDSLRQ